MNTKTTLTAAVAATAAASCHAGPVTFDYDGTGKGRNVSVMTEGFHSGRVYAGSIRHMVDGELAITYCIEPDQWAQTGTKTFDRVSLEQGLSHRASAGAKAAAIAELADSLGESLWTTSTDRDTAAAFQIAVWEIVRDLDTENEPGSLRFDDGSFRVKGSGNLVASAESMLSGLSFNRGSGSGYEAFTDDTKQDFMTRVVPTPAGFALAGTALPMLISRRRKG